MSHGRVYFLLRPDGLLKIGHTTDWKTRMACHGRSRGEVLGYIEGDVAHERHCHRVFQRYRVPGKRGVHDLRKPELFSVPCPDIERLRNFLRE